MNIRKKEYPRVRGGRERTREKKNEKNFLSFLYSPVPQWLTSVAQTTTSRATKTRMVPLIVAVKAFTWTRKGKKEKNVWTFRVQGIEDRPRSLRSGPDPALDWVLLPREDGNVVIGHSSKFTLNRFPSQRRRRRKGTKPASSSGDGGERERERERERQWKWKGFRKFIKLWGGSCPRDGERDV